MSYGQSIGLALQPEWVEKEMVSHRAQDFYAWFYFILSYDKISQTTIFYADNIWLIN